ncbi:MAG: hypothetical protein E7184_00880 [Erysipelotrichaceae bacterium]|nr:hypothetical protein [Erysipelotrichaceae bacterium]
MRCRKCAYEIGNARVCPACGTDQGHIKPFKKPKFDKKAFFLIKTSGKNHKKIVRNFILSIGLFFVGLHFIKNIEGVDRTKVIPVAILIMVYLATQTYLGYKNPAIDKSAEFKFRARFSTGLIIFYVVFCLSTEILKLV